MSITRTVGDKWSCTFVLAPIVGLLTMGQNTWLVLKDTVNIWKLEKRIASVQHNVVSNKEKLGNHGDLTDGEAFRLAQANEKAPLLVNPFKNELEGARRARREHFKYIGIGALRAIPVVGGIASAIFCWKGTDKFPKTPLSDSASH